MQLLQILCELQAHPPPQTAWKMGMFKGEL